MLDRSPHQSSCTPKDHLRFTQPALHHIRHRQYASYWRTVTRDNMRIMPQRSADFLVYAVDSIADGLEVELVRFSDAITSSKIAYASLDNRSRIITNHLPLTPLIPLPKSSDRSSNGQYQLYDESGSPSKFHLPRSFTQRRAHT